MILCDINWNAISFDMPVLFWVLAFKKEMEWLLHMDMLKKSEGCVQII